MKTQSWLREELVAYQASAAREAVPACPRPCAFLPGLRAARAAVPRQRPVRHGRLGGRAGADAHRGVAPWRCASCRTGRCAAVHDAAGAGRHDRLDRDAAALPSHRAQPRHGRGTACALAGLAAAGHSQSDRLLEARDGRRRRIAIAVPDRRAGPRDGRRDQLCGHPHSGAEQVVQIVSARPRLIISYPSIVLGWIGVGYDSRASMRSS